MNRRKIAPELSALGSVGGYKRKSFSELSESQLEFDTSNQVQSNNNIPTYEKTGIENQNFEQHSTITLIRGSNVKDIKFTSVDAWPNYSKAYCLEDVIGFGASAVVHAGLCIPRNEKCAIKRINLEQTKASMDEILKEIQVMCSCNHENVVNYYTSFVVEDELWIVLRLHEGGSLLDVIKQMMRTKDTTHGVLDEETIATVVKEVLKGLEYLHKSGQIHRDIKAGNILVGKDGSVQIADFGVSAGLVAAASSERIRKHTFVGTPCWMSPEVVESNGRGYDFKTDIWSLGITVIEMVRGTAPYMNFPPIKILMLVMQDESPKIETNAGEKQDYSKNYGKSIRSFVAACLTKDPIKRPSAAELLKHQFLKKAKDKDFLQEKFRKDPDAEKIVKTRRTLRTTPASTPPADWEWNEDKDN